MTSVILICILTMLKKAYEDGISSGSSLVEQAVSLCLYSPVTYAWPVNI